MRSIQWRGGFRTALVAAAAAGLVACATQSGVVEYAAEGSSVTTPDGLHRVKNWGFSNAYVKPGADMTRYRQVIIDPVTIAYQRPEDASRVSREGVARGTYALSPRAAEAFKRDYAETFSHQLGTSEIFSVGQQPAPDAIRISGHVIDLVVYAPPYEDREVASSQFLMERGRFTLVLDVRDATTGQPLLRVGDRTALKYDGADAFHPSNPVTSSSALRQIFHRLAGRLRDRLEEVHGLSQIPPAPAPAPTSS